MPSIQMPISGHKKLKNLAKPSILTLLSSIIKHFYLLPGWSIGALCSIIAVLLLSHRLVHSGYLSLYERKTWSIYRAMLMLVIAMNAAAWIFIESKLTLLLVYNLVILPVSCMIILFASLTSRKNELPLDEQNNLALDEDKRVIVKVKEAESLAEASPPFVPPHPAIQPETDMEGPNYALEGKIPQLDAVSVTDGRLNLESSVSDEACRDVKFDKSSILLNMNGPPASSLNAKPDAANLELKNAQIINDAEDFRMVNSGDNFPHQEPLEPRRLNRNQAATTERRSLPGKSFIAQESSLSDFLMSSLEPGTPPKKITTSTGGPLPLSLDLNTLDAETNRSKFKAHSPPLEPSNSELESTKQSKTISSSVVVEYNKEVVHLASSISSQKEKIENREVNILQSSPKIPFIPPKLKKKDQRELVAGLNILHSSSFGASIIAPNVDFDNGNNMMMAINDMNPAESAFEIEVGPMRSDDTISGSKNSNDIAADSNVTFLSGTVENVVRRVFGGNQNYDLSLLQDHMIAFFKYVTLEFSRQNKGIIKQLNNLHSVEYIKELYSEFCNSGTQQQSIYDPNDSLFITLICKATRELAPMYSLSLESLRAEFRDPSYHLANFDLFNLGTLDAYMDKVTKEKEHLCTRWNAMINSNTCEHLLMDPPTKEFQALLSVRKYTLEERTEPLKITEPTVFASIAKLTGKNGFPTLLDLYSCLRSQDPQLSEAFDSIAQLSTKLCMSAFLQFFKYWLPKSLPALISRLTDVANVTTDCNVDSFTKMFCYIRQSFEVNYLQHLLNDTEQQKLPDANEPGHYVIIESGRDICRQIRSDLSRVYWNARKLFGSKSEPTISTLLKKTKYSLAKILEQDPNGRSAETVRGLKGLLKLLSSVKAITPELEAERTMLRGQIYSKILAYPRVRRYQISTTLIQRATTALQGLALDQAPSTLGGRIEDYSGTYMDPSRYSSTRPSQNDEQEDNDFSSKDDGEDNPEDDNEIGWEEEDELDLASTIYWTRRTKRPLSYSENDEGQGEPSNQIPNSLSDGIIMSSNFDPSTDPVPDIEELLAALDLDCDDFPDVQ